MQDETFNGGKYPNSADTGLALSEFADDTATANRSTIAPPGASTPPLAMGGGRHKLSTFIRNNPGIAAAAGGLLLGFAVGIYAFSRRDR